MIIIQQQPFDIGELHERVAGESTSLGAVVSFIGRVRDFNESPDVQALTLEHYPGMTEKALGSIVEQAQSRWRIERALVVHRIGYMVPGDNIVAVLTASSHRQDAFDACAFIMDYLKIRAPFWKKEHTASGAYWVRERGSDLASLSRWEQT
ncbi:molybdopterin synthase catalytic subunit MoaE [Kushneria aurantia]|uniref:Molybdopterin synthase catalytic subunit n=1 Tax=Kushneria aurantia TaxID=504092 RepID=A0ABV6G1A0_9GAMM|nr:molybdopterin synthase catalytic subunit MoaE [Kushneria aurantia]